MKKTEHPVQLPDSLINRWLEDTDTPLSVQFQEAAEWGANAELEACCKWLNGGSKIDYDTAALLRAARRPEPPNLNSIALQMLGTIERDAHYIPEITDTIRRALEALPE
jgi:hypothetical protein